MLGRSFQFEFLKNKRRKRKKYIKNQPKFRKFRGQIKGVRPTNRPLVLLLPQTSDRNSFNLESLLNTGKQINYSTTTKRFTGSAGLEYQPVELDLLLSSGKHVLLLFSSFSSSSSCSSCSSRYRFVHHVVYAYILSYPIRSCRHSGNVERPFSKQAPVGGDQPRSSTVLWPGSD